MSNGIKSRQNEDNSIAMLAAQRKLYNEVGWLDAFNFALLVVLPIVFALLQELGTPWSWIRFLSYSLSIAMLYISSFSAKASREKKEAAASIQLAFDIYVFKMPWDRRLFGEQKNLNATIAEKSKKLLNDEKQKKMLLDWYTPTVDEMDLQKGIWACLRENYHWDAGLRKRYKVFAILLIAVIVAIIFITGLVNNEPIQEWIMRFVFVLPLGNWLSKLLSGLNDDLDRLKELDREFSSTGKRDMDDLQEMEKKITDHRKNAVKIPNLIYYRFRDNDEDREHRIVTMDSEPV